MFLRDSKAVLLYLKPVHHDLKPVHREQNLRVVMKNLSIVTSKLSYVTKKLSKVTGHITFVMNFRAFGRSGQHIAWVDWHFLSLFSPLLSFSRPPTTLSVRLPARRDSGRGVLGSQTTSQAPFQGCRHLVPTGAVQLPHQQAAISASEAPREHSAPPTVAQALQTVNGQRLAYTLQLPGNWTVKKMASEEFETLSASHGNLNIRIIAEETQVGTETIYRTARDRLKEHGTDVLWSEPQPLTLDGRTWLQFVAKCRVDRIPFGYQYYVYSGPEGTYQLIGWTHQNLFDRDADILQSTMRSFRVPIPKEPTPTRVNAAERSSNGLIWNALQQSAPRRIEILQLKVEQTMASAVVGRMLERTVLTLEAKDSGADHPGAGIAPFKEAVAKNLYIRKALGPIDSTVLTSLSAVLTSPDGARYVLFTLECKSQGRPTE